MEFLKFFYYSYLLSLYLKSIMCHFWYRAAPWLCSTDLESFTSFTDKFILQRILHQHNASWVYCHQRNERFINQTQNLSWALSTRLSISQYLEDAVTGISCEHNTVFNVTVIKTQLKWNSNRLVYVTHIHIYQVSKKTRVYPGVCYQHGNLDQDRW